ncbi:uncharacterized protein [Ptychodera flava]|uniref:uncharacterized protein n=1 Tax=Ptychodera flava TaxID=63121 RepID=UPI00396A33A2
MKRLDKGQTVHETTESGDTSISESSECYEPVEHPPSVANEEVVEITEDLSASEFIQENDENDRQSSIDVSSVQEGNTIDHEKQNCDEKKLRRKESAIASPSNSNNVVKISTPVKGKLTSSDSRGGERSLVKRSTNVETTTDSGGESMRDCIDVAESLVNLANTVVQRETSPSKSQKTKRTIEASDKHDEEIEEVVKSSSESQRQEQTTLAATDVELEKSDSTEGERIKTVSDEVTEVTKSKVDKTNKDSDSSAILKTRKRTADGDNNDQSEEMNHSDKARKKVRADTQISQSGRKFPSNLDVDKFLSKLHYVDS